jgi:plasmid stabilization system protein ParE
MSFRLRITPLAQQDIDELAAYLGAYSESFAVEQIDQLNRILFDSVAVSPHTWAYFPLTGAPYRAYLFRVGRKTHYWVIYTVDEEAKAVNVLRLWNASRDPGSLDL